MSTHVVHINVDADWHFTYTDENGHSAFSLKAKVGDWIKWTCNKPGFLVNFVDTAVEPRKNQSPFAQDQYHSLGSDQHTIPRQEIIRWRNDPFPYTVKLDSGQSDDPDIQVDNPSANLKWMLLAAAALVAGLVVAKQISED